MRLVFALLALSFTVACGSSTNLESHLSAPPSVEGKFPLGPDQSMTPGETCSNPSEYRYPERIPYCSRSVSTSLKRQIIKTYDKTFSYSISSMPRNDFKIDHYIPLCMGGSNNDTNLWPQHKSVYVITDEFEMKLCLYLEKGRMTQAQAIEYIKQIKNNLDEVREIEQEIESTYGSV